MQTIPLDNILVGERIREYDEKYCVELARSIRDEGLLHPIVLRRDDNRIIAGGHRYRAHQLLSCGEVESADPDFYARVPFQYFDEYLIESGKIQEGESISDSKLRKMEIEENIRRKDMTWWERMFGVVDYHKTCGKEARQLGDDWTQSMTGELLGISQAHVSNALDIAKAMRSGDHPRMFELGSLVEANKYLAEVKLREVVKEQERRAKVKREELLAAAKAKSRVVTKPKVTAIDLTPLPQTNEPEPIYSDEFVGNLFVDSLSECELLLPSPFDKVSSLDQAGYLETVDWRWAVLWCYINNYEDLVCDLKAMSYVPLPAPFLWVDSSSGVQSNAMMPNKVNVAIIVKSSTDHKFTRQVDKNFYESTTPTGALRWLISLLTAGNDSVYDPNGVHHWSVAASALEQRISFVNSAHKDTLTEKITLTLQNNLPNTITANAKSPFSSLPGLSGL